MMYYNIAGRWHGRVRSRRSVTIGSMHSVAIDSKLLARKRAASHDQTQEGQLYEPTAVVPNSHTVIKAGRTMRHPHLSFHAASAVFDAAPTASSAPAACAQARPALFDKSHLSVRAVAKHSLVGGL